MIEKLFSSSMRGKISKAAFFLFITTMLFSAAQVNAKGINGTLSKESAQANEIKGTVSDETGNPLPGVTILVKGTQVGAITDAKGNFTLNSPTEKATLVISFIGYKTVEIEGSTSAPVAIQLAPDATTLDEVVVVGYGSQKKSLVTGAISGVKSDDIKSTSISRAEQALQGKTSGVQVLPNNGSPGAGMNIRIRGYSFNGNSNPIFIVDGVKTSDINFLDPNDIASMEVLKDAASSAIYGAEGGNGVVMITTKQGQKGRTQVSYDYQMGFQSVGKLPKLMNSSQYAQYMKEANPASTIDQTYNTDWLKEIFETGSITKHHLSFSGGNEKSTFLLALSYLKNDGIIKGDKDRYERYGARFNSEHKMTSWLKVGNNFNYSRYSRSAIDETDGDMGGVIGSALQIDPTTPVEYTSAIPSASQTIINNHASVLKAPDGNYYGISPNVRGEIVNPFVNLAITNGGITRDNLNGNFYVEITPIKDLTYTSRIGLDLAYQNNHYWTPSYYYSDEKSNGNALVIDNNDLYRTWLWENFVSYNKKISDNTISVMAGMSSEDYIHKFSNVKGGPMIVEAQPYAQLNYLATQGNDLLSGYPSENKKISYFGRVSYDYKNKYLLQGSIRRDGAGLSQLPGSGRWGVFPSFSAGWLVSNESFFPKTVLSYAKVRGSWGQNGSLSNLIDFMYSDNVVQTNSNSTILYPTSSSLAVVSEPAQILNPNLKWETSQQTDFGIDLKALSDKLSLSIDYYIKKTKDLIVVVDPYSFPTVQGNYPSPFNGGNVENKGLEFDLGYRGSAGDFKYSVNANLSTLNNKVTYVDPSVGRVKGANIGPGGNWAATMFEEGYPMWHFNGFKTNGINPTTGDPVFVKKDGTLTNGDGVTADDMTDIGSPIPKIIYGGSINLEYKGIDLAVSFSGMSGNKVLMGWIRSDRTTVNKPTEFFDDRWTSANTAASKPKADATANTWKSDLLVFDGSFLRVQQIQLGYKLPANILKTIKLSNLRVYVSLENYFLFTKYPGMDPQASPLGQTSNVNNANGIDRGTYPVPRNILLGASISF